MSAPIRVPGDVLVHLRRARDHADRHYAEPLCLDDLAEVAGLGKFHFQRLFTATYRLSPAAYISQRRVERAMDQGQMRGIGLAVGDCKATDDDLTAQGVEFLQPPFERPPYGVEAPHARQLRELARPRRAQRRQSGGDERRPPRLTHRERLGQGYRLRKDPSAGGEHPDGNAVRTRTRDASVVLLTPEDVLRLAGSAPERWSELELLHRSDYLDVQATLRHGELDGVRLSDGHRIHERGAPPSSWTVRPLEPYATNYTWSAMLDPYELTEGVMVTEVRREELFGRPVVAFVARAVPGYDPVCSCCPLVFSEVSQQLEHGEEWTAQPGELPDGVDMALDLEVGIVVSSRDRGGRLGSWFTNEILRGPGAAAPG